MEYLTPPQILFIHHRLIETTGGSHGIRDLGALQAAAARPQATFGGDDLYADLSTKAAALMQSLIKNHPFLDGNKRTAIAAAGLFLRRNGLRLIASQEQLYEFTMEMAAGAVELSQAAKWLKGHSRTA